MLHRRTPPYSIRNFGDASYGPHAPSLAENSKRLFEPQHGGRQRVKIFEDGNAIFEPVP